MSPTDHEAEAYLREKLGRLPGRLHDAVHWLLLPESRWVRWPAGLLFICGGLLWFLPVLGLWMLPLGLFLIAEDIPPLKRWLVGLLMAGERRWRRWRG